MLCWAALGAAIFGPLMGLFFAGTDLIIGAIGAGIFALNILYNSNRLIYETARDFVSTISKISFKNFSNPSEWKVPEGEGRFKNWNRPGKWCLNPWGC